MGMEVLLQKGQISQAPIRLAQPFWALELRAENYGHQAFSEVSTPPKWCETPLGTYYCHLVSHRHMRAMCAIPCFATHRARIVRCPIKTSTTVYPNNSPPCPEKIQGNSHSLLELPDVDAPRNVRMADSSANISRNYISETERESIP